MAKKSVQHFVFSNQSSVILSDNFKISQLYEKATTH